MTRIIRLTESDLTRIVRRVISEQVDNYESKIRSYAIEKFKADGVFQPEVKKYSDNQWLGILKDVFVKPKRHQWQDITDTTKIDERKDIIYAQVEFDISPSYNNDSSGTCRGEVYLNAMHYVKEAPLNSLADAENTIDTLKSLWHVLNQIKNKDMEMPNEGNRNNGLGEWLISNGFKSM
jgi:hypothetical protein